MKKVPPTKMQSWYAGKTILVTGATGFMGKVLLEKMLRDLPHIAKIFILMRPKRGLTVENRLEAIKKLPVFERLLSSNEAVLSKLHIIEGNLSEVDLGINDEDRKLVIEETDIVFHMAASLRLESGVQDAVLQNTLGTQRVFDLCEKMQHVKSVVHLSTAFCHCDVDVLDEVIYPPGKNPYEVIEMVQRGEQISDNEKDSFIAPHPNAYTFSKRLAETVAWDAGTKLPMAIARPSIVIPALREPCSGWVDSLNGPVGILVAAGKGVLRSMLVRAENHAEVVPVDIAINALITIAWLRDTKSFDETPIYNLSQSRDVLDITWGEVLLRGKKLTYENPFEWMLWYPDGNIRTNTFIHALVILFFQRLPAYFIDFLLLIFMQKRFMVRVQDKIAVGLNVLQYFTLREWNFRNKQSLALTDCLSNEDREVFPMANAKFDIDDYLEMTILGARKYCMKEDLKTLPFWRIYLKFLFVLNKICVYGFYYLMIWIAMAIVGKSDMLSMDYWMSQEYLVQQEIVQ